MKSGKREAVHGAHQGPLELWERNLTSNTSNASCLQFADSIQMPSLALPRPARALQMSMLATHARLVPVTLGHRARLSGTTRRAHPTLAADEARGKEQLIRTMPRRAALALSVSASLETASVAFGANASSTGEATAPSFVNAFADGTAGTRNRSVMFDDVKITIQSSGQQVPVATWYPSEVFPITEETSTTNNASNESYYPHAISVAKIARVLLNTPDSTPRWLDRETPLRASAGVRFASESGSATADKNKNIKGVCVLCHGYLGSRFDLVDLAETLAFEGFLVLAPEFAESLSTPSTTPAYSRPGKPPPANPSATRNEIINAMLSVYVPNFYNDSVSDSVRQKTKVVIAGQSAGASTATSAPGPFAARVAIAGFRPPEDETKKRKLLDDPLLIVASAGDGVISLYPKESGAFGPYEGIESSVQGFFGGFGEPVAKVDIDQFAKRIEETSASTGEGTTVSAQTLTSFLTYERIDGGVDNTLPCHISFLSSRTNDAMVEVLSPLLPLARGLGVPVLDFDKYQVTKDSDAVNGKLVPLIARWMEQAVEL